MAQSQVAGATIAQRPQPQTTQNPGPGPFIAHAVHASRPAYAHANVALGGVVTDPLPQAPGYLRKIRLTLLGGGGAQGSTVTATTDMLSCVSQVLQLIQLKDPMGTPIITGSGYDMLFLAPLFSGQLGILRSLDVRLYPTYQPVKAAGTSTDTGNFGADLALPLEGTLAYGLVAVGNASALPTLLINLNPSSSVYTTAPSTAPTVSVNVDYDYYAVADPSIEPPGLGTTFQWQSVPANPTIGSGASQRVQLPRTAGYMHTLILVLRDANGARLDAWGTRTRLYVDGVPVYDDSTAVYGSSGTGETAAYVGATAVGVSGWAQVRMFLESGGFVGSILNGGQAGTSAVSTIRPAGVLAYSWRESIAQVNLGLADTQLRLPPITPGTLIEIEGTPWGTVGSPPATLTAIYGMVVPRGMLMTGLPESGQ